MYENLTKLQTDALSELTAAADAEALEAWRVKYLSRKGGALGEAVKTLPAPCRAGTSGLRAGGQRCESGR